VVVGSSPAAPATLLGPPAHEGQERIVFRRIRRFVDESYSELKKVTWPTREQTRNLTVLVFVISAAVGAYIGVFDVLFNELLKLVSQTV
jgi:preprotein translocase subunit SecE